MPLINIDPMHPALVSLYYVRPYSPIGGNGARVLFAERDTRGSEDISPVQITVRVEGENTGNFTVVVTPLTVAQYQAQGDVYGKICDSVLKQFEKIDTAEGK